MPSSATRQLFDPDCSPIRTVSKAFHDQLCVQGSGKLATGETVSFAKRGCACAAVCPRTGQHICFERLDPHRFPHGRGAMGTPITPLRTVAVDPDRIPLGTVLYIPEYHGLRDLGGRPHDGCFIAQDRGLRVRAADPQSRSRCGNNSGSHGIDRQRRLRIPTNRRENGGNSTWPMSLARIV